MTGRPAALIRRMALGAGAALLAVSLWYVKRCEEL